MRDGGIEAALENYKLQPSAPRSIPEAAIQYCLLKGGVTWGDIDLVGIAGDPFSGWGRRAFSRRCLLPLVPVTTGYKQGRELRRFARENRHSFQQRLHDTHKMVSLDRHCCHAANAFFLSPFVKALILTLDGEGDGNAGLLAVIRVQDMMSSSNSIVRIYAIDRAAWLYSVERRTPDAMAGLA